MYIPKSLKLNRFRIVQIPSAKEIITRFGFSAGSNYSGDEFAPKTMSKTDAALALDEANHVQAQREMTTEE